MMFTLSARRSHGVHFGEISPQDRPETAPNPPRGAHDAPQYDPKGGSKKEPELAFRGFHPGMANENADKPPRSAREAPAGPQEAPGKPLRDCKKTPQRLQGACNGHPKCPPRDHPPSDPKRNLRRLLSMTQARWRGGPKATKDSLGAPPTQLPYQHGRAPSCRSAVCKFVRLRTWFFNRLGLKPTVVRIVCDVVRTIR